MNRKNDFSPKTKKILASRAGYKCCYLGCGQSTIGPSREDNNSRISNTGDAAHIFSASLGSGARRRPPIDMTSDEIKNIENGIWMCATHARYIDTDETTFTVDQLKKWKTIGENIARVMQSTNSHYHEALEKLKNHDNEISEMIAFAQKNDQSNDQHSTLDLLLYKKILELIPDYIRSNIRQCAYIHIHHASERKILTDYLHFSEDNPVEFSFTDDQLQKYKKCFDDALDKLVSCLALNTFYQPHKNGIEYYAMSSEWKRTEEGCQQYITAENNICKLSAEAIEKFDDFHKACRKKFGE